MEYKFDSTEVYKKIIPCLNSKVQELKRYGIDNVTKEDIWNYFMRDKWKDDVPYLSDMVDDVLKLDSSKIKEYVEEEIKNRKVEREGSELL